MHQGTSRGDTLLKAVDSPKNLSIVCFLNFRISGMMVGFEEEWEIVGRGYQEACIK